MPHDIQQTTANNQTLCPADDLQKLREAHPNLVTPERERIFAFMQARYVQMMPWRQIALEANQAGYTLGKPWADHGRDAGNFHVRHKCFWPGSAGAVLDSAGKDVSAAEVAPVDSEEFVDDFQPQKVQDEAPKRRGRPPKRRGRPPKRREPEPDDDDLDDEDDEDDFDDDDLDDEDDEDDDAEPCPPRRRGRPPKVREPEPKNKAKVGAARKPFTVDDDDDEWPSEPEPPRRGRPPGSKSKNVARYTPDPVGMDLTRKIKGGTVVVKINDDDVINGTVTTIFTIQHKGPRLDHTTLRVLKMAQQVATLYGLR